jgi:predicted Zn-dependent protease
MKRKVVFLSAGALFVALTIWIISCAVNPVTGKREFMLLSERDEIALGGQTDQQIIQTYGIYDDPELNAYVNDLGQRMSKKTHRPNLNYSFKVLDTAVINAFAVPGGYVYFTRGIMGYLNNEAEFAGVLGHELGHINAKHSAQQYSRAQLAQIGLGVGMIFSESFRQYAGLAQFGVQMLFLRFSRDNERQADDLGVEYSINMGYDSNGMATFFETLERMHPSSGRDGLPEWFSTHPNPVNRIAAVRNKTAEWKSKKPGTYAVNKNEYLQQVDGLVFGDDPQQGYVDGQAFYHPAMKFMFSVPAQWQLNNTPSQVQMVSQKQDAAIIFTLGSSGSPQQAAQEFQANTIRVLSSDAVRVNGMSAHRVVSHVPSDNDTLQVMSYFIQKESQIFVFHGFTSRPSYAGYRNSFSSTMGNFKRLTDPKRINVQPSHVKVVNIKSAGTLKSRLSALGVSQDKLDEIALLNGKQLDDRVSANTRVKLIR